jgi:hypothetical protein
MIAWRRFTLLAAIAIVSLSGAACRTATGQSAGRYIDDATITAQVKTRLVAAEAANLTRVDVDTHNGTVYLNGVVETPVQKARAESIARSEEGVRRVVNNLQVASRSLRSRPSQRPSSRARAGVTGPAERRATA